MDNTVSEAISYKMKIPVPGAIIHEVFRGPKTMQNYTIAIGCSPKVDVHTWLLKTPYSFIAELRESILELKWRLSFCYLSLTVLGVTFQASRVGKSTTVYHSFRLECYNTLVV